MAINESFGCTKATQFRLTGFELRCRSTFSRAAIGSPCRSVGADSLGACIMDKLCVIVCWGQRCRQIWRSIKN